MLKLKGKVRASRAWGYRGVKVSFNAKMIKLFIVMGFLFG